MGHIFCFLICHVCTSILTDGKAEGGFGQADVVRGFLSNMQCVGSENELKKCEKERATGDCKSAGVTCKKSFSKPELYHNCKRIMIFFSDTRRCSSDEHSALNERFRSVLFSSVISA